MSLIGHEVDFNKGGVTEFKCNTCGATNTVLNAIFPETYVPKCKDCDYTPMQLVKRTTVTK